ncbi:MAG: bifunctional ADP-heptose synthase [Saprospiraceae bacterium]|nr:bifunctional ADP-heptose synthase [Saprospiraceae bacterium]
MSELKKIENQLVMIIGDVMIDRYLTGTVSRISPEAPVPVVLHKSTDNRLGGAANVALNVTALGGQPILCSVVGNDLEGKLFTEMLNEQNISSSGIIVSDKRRTTVKTRILGNNQQMLRIDSEDTYDLTKEEESNLTKKIISLLDQQKDIRVLVLQDYNKGLLTPGLIRKTLLEAKKRGIFTAVDPKKANFYAYEGVDLFKPNLKEIRESAPFPIVTEDDSLQAACDYVRKKLNNRYTMLTLSEKGLYLDDRGQGRRYPTLARNVADVSGAGDTVISIAAMALAAGIPQETVAWLSNSAGGQVCEYPGVVPVNKEILEKELATAND